MGVPTAGRLRIIHGLAGDGIATGAPLLAGPDTPFLEFDVAQCLGEWTLGHAADFRIAVFSSPVESISRLTERAYGELLELLRAGEQLLRVWHFVPHINETHSGDEQYRLFCEGRMSAFERRGLTRFPAASAVGSSTERFTMIAIAASDPIVMYENPSQIPAYKYPKIYGEKPPGFSRAASIAKNAKSAYISGTSSIRGHASVCAGDFSGQWEVTLKNLHELARQMPDIDLGEEGSRIVCYLRRDKDLAVAREGVRRWLGEDALHQARFLRADICRADLLVEIEWEGVTPFRGPCEL